MTRDVTSGVGRYSTKLMLKGSQPQLWLRYRSRLNYRMRLGFMRQRRLTQWVAARPSISAPIEAPFALRVRGVVNAVFNWKYVIK